ncbi:unconventional myosin-IXb isoform X3 [Nothobranchius furzeri]|uniref:unconventional myosin-IXb isoform X3 n=1 Tax=Nothobranchius furzeri TaxID=105023 RepID=UPI003904A50A
MSTTTNGAGPPKQEGESRVVQVYLKLSPETETHCPLQVSIRDTSRTIINNAVVTLGLDSSLIYRLLEVKDNESQETVLDDEDSPLLRVMLWPPETQRWHPRSQGYYFLLQRQINNEAKAVKEDSDDLCDLSSVTQEKVLEALRQRFYKCKIYTYISNILIAINPNKFLPLYYNPKYVKMYENQPLGQLSPHIFAIADVAFRTMLDRQANQCLVISGESGSGKTESSNYLIHCLTSLSRGTYSSGLERTILGAGPVLEAFGNAKTKENYNSSRFGKFIQLNYLESGVIRGAVVEKFLLEKSRLVSRDKSERNFHVFYYLLMGAPKEEQEEFHLLKSQDYLYLSQKDLSSDAEEKLGQEYKRLHQAMEMVGFLPSTKKHIFSIVAAILHLGNVTFTHSKSTQVLEAGPANVLSTLSNLLKIKKELLVTTLTKRKMVMANSTIVSQYTLQEAVLKRDSMAQSLYSALFDWIILHINHAMLNRRDMEESVSCLSIGVLDMFGFENLKTNSFEQLCINYANEKLHCYINKHIFELEQEDYLSEGIIWLNIDFIDNSGCIQLLNNKPVGLFGLLNEESSCPRATDEATLSKFKQHHQDNPFFVASPNKEPTFVIKHYPGGVKYNITDFRKKNTEHMRPEVVFLLRSSERSFLHHLVASSPEALFRWGILRATIRIVSVFKKMGRAELSARQSSPMSLKDAKQYKNQISRLSSSNSMTLDFSFDHSDENPPDFLQDIFADYELRNKNQGSRKKQIIPKNLMNLCSLKHIVGLTEHDRTGKSIFHPQGREKPPTVSTQFQASLGKLMDIIEKAEPFFIFCLRSNAEKRELHFDDDVVLKQIKYTGLLQMIDMQKSGYRAKYTLKDFAEKFWILLPKGTSGSPQHITELFERMNLNTTTYQIGKNKVFLKDKERLLLQETLNKEVMRRIVTLQRWFRSCLIRFHFLQKKDATTLIQRSWREFYEKQNRAATVIQTAWSTYRQRAKICEKEDKDGSWARTSLEKKQLRRQYKLDVSPSRKQQPDPSRGQPELEDTSKWKRDSRGSTHPLNRPFSIPLDPKTRINSPTSPLHPYADIQGTTRKDERLKERVNVVVPTDETSLEVRRRREKRDDFFRKGKSMSADELSKTSSSGSESSPSATEVRVRLRKQKKHKRHLACTRSRLMGNLGNSTESEYWSFPLPPVSPTVPGLKGSVSSTDVRTLTSQGKTGAETDSSCLSLPTRATYDNAGQHGSNQSHPTTPERTGFLGKFLKKRTHKSSPTNEYPSDKTVTLPSYTPHSYQASNQSNGRAHRSPSVCISRATRALQWDASLDREITDPRELRHLDEFLGVQVNELQTRMKELSPTENTFLCATKEFREGIKSMYSVQKPKIGYKDLMKSYHNTVKALAGPLSDVSLVINLFQSVLDGFIRTEIKRADSEPNKATKATKKRRKNEKCLESPLDHLFSTYQVNIMQSCDLCGSFIWGMEKAYMCSACKFVCHKRCLDKIITDCSTRCARKDDSVPGSLHFGVQVCVLTSKTNPVPKVMELLLMHVELNGLYTEGIYRKSGAACRAKELYQVLETNPEKVCLDNYPIHTITGLVKRWLRDLPDPLMTFSLYNDFLLATELPENSERLKAVYKKIDELPPANYNTLERLLFHLVKVVKEEKHNKMSPGSLAIVFAPCILRAPESSDPFSGLRDVSKTTFCVEILICEQLRRYNKKMQDIQKLEHAETEAINELKLKRQNTVLERPDERESTLIERIKSLKQEKAEVAIGLRDLEQETSDCEVMDSSSSMSTESLDLLGSQEWMALQLKTLKCDSPHNPADLAQSVTSVAAKTEQRHLTSEQNANVAQSTTSRNTPSPSNKLQIKSQANNRSFNDLDIPFIDEVED